MADQKTSQPTIKSLQEEVAAQQAKIRELEARLSTVKGASLSPAKLKDKATKAVFGFIKDDEKSGKHQFHGVGPDVDVYITGSGNVFIEKKEKELLKYVVETGDVAYKAVPNASKKEVSLVKIGREAITKITEKK